MAIHEFSVPDDFFECENLLDTELDFPCCCCRHKGNSETSFPCKFCGHNTNADEHYSCATCGNLQPGNRYEDGKYIAKHTPAKIGPLCPVCYNSIVANVADR